MHQARWGRPCLALDLIEEFRPVIVDAVVLRCITSGVVKFEEFTVTPGVGCRWGTGPGRRSLRRTSAGC